MDKEQYATRNMLEVILVLYGIYLVYVVLVYKKNSA